MTIHEVRPLQGPAGLPGLQDIAAGAPVPGPEMGVAALGTGGTGNYSYQEIEQVIRATAAEHLQTGAMPLGNNLAEDLDSVQKLTLLVALEDHFNIALDPTQDTAIHTLHDLVLALQAAIEETSYGEGLGSGNGSGIPGTRPVASADAAYLSP